MKGRVRRYLAQMEKSPDAPELEMERRNRIKTLILVLIIIGLLSEGSFSQYQLQINERQNPSPESVSVYAQVLSRKTNLFVGGLRKEDLSIFQGGVRKETTEFIEEDSPVSVVFLLDVSGSMQYDINLIKAVVTESLRALRREDEVSLVTFSEKPAVVLEFTKDKSLVNQKIGELSRKNIHGATNEREGLFSAAMHLNNASNSSGRRIILVITDNYSNNPFQPHSQKDVINTLTVAGVKVHGLITPRDGLQSGAMPVFNFRSGVGPYVQETGGVLLDLGNERLSSKLNALMRNLHKRYVLRFIPTDLKGNKRNGEIKLKISPEVEKREDKLEVLIRPSL